MTSADVSEELYEVWETANNLGRVFAVGEGHAAALVGMLMEFAKAGQAQCLNVDLNDHGTATKDDAAWAVRDFSVKGPHTQAFLDMLMTLPDYLDEYVLEEFLDLRKKRNEPS